MADLWVNATPTERIVFEQIILELETDLKNDPHSVGKLRNDGTRVVVVPPLIFWFRVENRVRIFRVKRIGRG